MTHTPGPWVFRDPEGDELHEIYAESGRELICFPVWTHNQKANIPLIAAAPELLAALRLAMEWSEDDGYPDDHCMVGPCERAFRQAARAAIAKAEGRSDDNEV